MLKKTALFCAMVGGLASSAFAANANIGTLDLSPDGYSITKDSIFAGAFTDTYSFSLSQVSELFGSIDTSFSRKLNLVTSDILLPTLKLFYSADSNFGSDSLIGTAAIQTFNAGAGSFEFGVINYSGAAASAGGFYYFEVTGTAVGAKGGSYDFGATAAPVPEPTAAAMLIAGFAVMGFIAMRRRRQD